MMEMQGVDAFRSVMSRLRATFAGISCWEPNRFDGGRRWLGFLGALTVLLYAFLGISALGFAGKLIYVLMLSSVVFFFTAPVEVRRSTVFVLLLVSVCVPLASWALSLLTHPELAEKSPKVNRVVNWLLPITVAFALGGHTRNTLLAWAAALLGLLVATWFGGGLKEILRGLDGYRVDFGLHNAQHTAMYFGVALLGLLNFLPRLMARQSSRWFIFPVWLALAVFMTTCVIIVQTRAVWLGLSVSLLVMAVMFAQSLRHYRGLMLGLMIATASLLFLLGQSELVERRVESELKTFTSAFQGSLEQIPFDSSGIRLRSWVEAADWIEQRPIFGWGGKGRGLVMKQATSFPESVRQRFRHLHNSYLDTLVNFGAVGLLLLLGLWSWLTYASIAAYRRGVLPRDMLQFFISFMVFWATINFFESYVYFFSGTFVFALVAGGVLSHIWLYQQIDVSKGVL
ncbi:O-antigen ligase family protein [Methylicorpusculum oleiharenae]|uniref:O-antigen ligase family protein n=1 Tax=Methylicorpusculum oleiharenae TaxID=1338687 RepID=UPI00135BB80B|nr:O-antigen ligase family protein [Methylicorpusculum oleiharenae]MCD2449147.1 O-antigen ligase family protein [Methylicorpusculum oleiharenae]